MSPSKPILLIGVMSMLSMINASAYADLYISPVKKNAKVVYYQQKPSILPNVPGQLRFGRDLPVSYTHLTLPTSG